MSWVIRGEELVERGSKRDFETRRPRGPSSELPRPHVVRDSMDGLQSQQDGNVYESKSQLLRAYKESGVRVFEPGETLQKPERPRITDQEIGEAVQMVRQGYKPELPDFSTLATEDF